MGRTVKLYFSGLAVSAYQNANTIRYGGSIFLILPLRYLSSSRADLGSKGAWKQYWTANDQHREWWDWHSTWYGNVLRANSLRDCMGVSGTTPIETLWFWFNGNAILQMRYYFVCNMADRCSLRQPLRLVNVPPGHVERTEETEYREIVDWQQKTPKH